MSDKTNVQLPLSRPALDLIDAFGLLHDPPLTKRTVMIRLLLATHPDLLRIANEVLKVTPEQVKERFTEDTPGGFRPTRNVYYAPE